mmetsp:Transcript_34363/g.45980  ORF Transcript_34363/g.45980 Transcript_34363/m.45980 type:complete len:341 (-) Transcript_34363:433-1455(-)
MDEDPILLRGHHLLLEVSNTHDNTIYTNILYRKAKEFGKLFLEQLQSRNLLFGELLTEFSKLIDFSDKKIIQRAAAVQALCSVHLKAGDGNHIDFIGFSSTALWYQQEILSLVMRVYCEDQLMDNLDRGDYSKFYVPSALQDAPKCKQDMEEKKTAPSARRKHSFEKLIAFLVNELTEDDYDVQGPVLKPIQSLFNKMFIRRGQTAVSVIGDMTRATLLVKNEKDLRVIVKRVEEAFPSIHGKEFQGPSEVGVDTFLHQVFKMKKVPESDVIPYRFKANSSQKKRMDKGEPLLYNLNFFDGIPEYHRVGTTEMFVAFELQIGFEAEVNGLRVDHLAYEEG